MAEYTTQSLQHEHRGIPGSCGTRASYDALSSSVVNFADQEWLNMYKSIFAHTRKYYSTLLLSDQPCPKYCRQLPKETLGHCWQDCLFGRTKLATCKRLFKVVDISKRSRNFSTTTYRCESSSSWTEDFSTIVVYSLALSDDHAVLEILRSKVTHSFCLFKGRRICRIASWVDHRPTPTRPPGPSVSRGFCRSHRLWLMDSSDEIFSLYFELHLIIEWSCSSLECCMTSRTLSLDIPKPTLAFRDNHRTSACHNFVIFRPVCGISGSQTGRGST